MLALLTVVDGFSAKSRYDNADTLVVASDGTGDFCTVQGAIDACLPFRDYLKVIYVKKGVYKEKINLPSHLTNIEVVGENRDSTLIIYDDYAKKKSPYTGKALGTFGSYTFRIQGQLITLRNLTIENSTQVHSQAVALHTDGDRISIVNCRLLGTVDTIYTGTIGSRLYFLNCYIEGTLDFIFGPATAWFEGCTIHSKSNEYITAASTPAYQQYGYIFNNCKLTAAEGVKHCYLGRPWRSKGAYTLFMNCYIGSHVAPEGWRDWENKAQSGDIRYYEYGNKGAGATTTKRVSWSRQLTVAEAKAITPHTVLGDFSFAGEIIQNSK